MKFWRNAAALLMVFHPETTHPGNHSTPKDVKNEGRPGYVYENKGPMDKMSETISDICARLKPFLQKIRVSSFPNNCKAAFLKAGCTHTVSSHHGREKCGLVPPVELM